MPDQLSASVRTTRPLVVFADARLSEPWVLHSQSCRAGLDELGRFSNRTCRCRLASTQVQKGHVGVLLRIEDNAALVRFSALAPVWLEKNGLKSSRQVSDFALRSSSTGIMRQAPPPDHLAVCNALTRELPRRLVRRRREPRCGEIVWLRSSLSSGRPQPLRLLFCCFFEDKPTAAFIDTALNPQQALSPSWAQLQLFELPRGLDRVSSIAYPVFPLPDGQEDPGWARM